MNKAQLIEEIDKLPDDIEFIVSQDAEGNSFSDLEGISVEYVDKTDYAVGSIDAVFSEEDLAQDYAGEEELIPEIFRPVAVIWRI